LPCGAILCIAVVSGKPVEVRIRGEEIKILRHISHQMQGYLKTVAGVKEVQDDLERGKQELVVKVDEEKAALYGIHVQDVAIALKTYYDGFKTSEIHQKKDQIDVVVKLASEFRSDFGILNTLKVANRSGELIPLSSIADFTLTEGSGVIRRKDQRRAVTVTADVDTETVTSSEVKKMVEGQFKELSKTYPGYSFAFAGEQKEQMESVQSLIEGQAPTTIPKNTFLVEMAGKLVMRTPGTDTELFRLSGAFSMEISEDGVDIFVAAEMQVGPPDFTLFSFSAVGLLVIRESGFAAKFDLTYEIGDPSVLDFAINFKLQTNVTLQDQEYRISDTFIDGGYLSADYQQWALCFCKHFP